MGIIGAVSGLGLGIVSEVVVWELFETSVLTGTTREPQQIP